MKGFKLTNLKLVVGKHSYRLHKLSERHDLGKRTVYAIKNISPSTGKYRYSPINYPYYRELHAIKKVR